MAIPIVAMRLPSAFLLTAILVSPLQAEQETFVSCPGSSEWSAALQAAQSYHGEIYKAGTAEAAVSEAFLAAWTAHAMGLTHGRLPGVDPISRSALWLLVDYVRGRCLQIEVRAEVSK